MNYITNIPRKFNGVRYNEGDKIPENEFLQHQELLVTLIENGSITATSKSLSKKESSDFNAQAVKVEGSKSPDLQSMEWREAVDTIMEITVSETLLRLKIQENKRTTPRKSVLKALQTQLKIYSG